MDHSFWFDVVNLGWSIVYSEKSKLIVSVYKMYFFSLRIVFVLANSVDHDEMPLYATFHLGLHCLPKYTFRSH